MATTQTDRLGLTRWSEDADAFTRDQMDQSHAQLEDLAVGYLRDTLANRPAADAAFEGFIFEDVDTGDRSWCDGSQWVEVSPDLVVTVIETINSLAGGATRILATDNLLGRWDIGNTTVGGSAGMLSATPFVVERAETITEVEVSVNGASATSGAQGKLLLYHHDNGLGLPGAQLLDIGTVAVDSTGDKTITGLAQSVDPGIYWFAYLTEVGDEALESATIAVPLLGHRSSGATDFDGIGKVYADAAPGWPSSPDPFPTVGPSAISQSADLNGTIHAKLGV